jgi:Trm5-related predicted tRNA methylase
MTTIRPESDLSGDVWSAAQIENAVVAVLTSHFSDWRLTEIEISEREARSIASEIIALLHGDNA